MAGLSFPGAARGGARGYADEQLQLLGGFLLLSIFAAFIASGVAVATTKGPQSVAIVVLISLGGLTSGAFIGFLFGLPKSVPPSAAQGAPAGANPAPGAPAPPATPPWSFNTNTNLEEVSDWLTKIVVGLGLVQLTNINKYLVMFEDAVAAANKGGSPLLPFSATVMVVVCALLGFLGMYIMARTVLSRVLTDFANSFNDTLVTAISQITDAGGAGADAVAPAADALKAAAQMRPDDARLRNVAVKALAATGRAGDAASLLPTSDLNDVDDQINRMLLSLYDGAQGYKTTISISDALSSRPAATGRADYWFYRAAALGHKYSALATASPPAPQGDLDEVGSLVLEAAQKAVGLDASYKTRLLALARPTPGSTDDDLKAFANDKDLMTILGASTAG